MDNFSFLTPLFQIYGKKTLPHTKWGKRKNIFQIYLYRKITDTQRFLDMHDFQQDVNRIMKWCQRNRLSINVKKTKLVFHPHNCNIENNVHHDITILNSPVSYVSTYLYLGADIDNQLTFKTFYNNTFKKISYKLSL